MKDNEEKDAEADSKPLPSDIFGSSDDEDADGDADADEIDFGMEDDGNKAKKRARLDVPVYDEGIGAKDEEPLDSAASTSQPGKRQRIIKQRVADVEVDEDESMDIDTSLPAEEKIGETSLHRRSLAITDSDEDD